jgi:hypothetical protein
LFRVATSGREASGCCRRRLGNGGDERIGLNAHLALDLLNEQDAEAILICY